MSVEVIVLLEGSDEVVLVNGDRWHEFSLARIDHLRWANLATEIARRAAAREPFRVDLYLHFKGDHLAGRYDYDFVEKLLELAREHAWGGRVFVVLDQGILRHPDDVRDNLPLIAHWLETVHRGSVADIVLTNFSRGNPAPPPPGDLKKAGLNCRKQFNNLPRLVAPGIWRCWPVPRSALERLSFDDDLMPGGRGADRNFLIVVDRKGAITADEKNEIKKFIRKNGGGRFALAVVGIAASKLPTDLLTLATELSLRVIEFRGWLDLRFFLARLNRLCISHVPLLPETIQAVTVETGQPFGSSKKPLPGLLITSGFNHQADSALCRETARDVGKLLHVVCQRAEYLIHPSLRAGELSALFAATKELTAWWFIGHGKRAHGLQDVDGRMMSPSEWLEKIPRCGKKLPLAFFSACRSAETAQAFARAGVGVAIGFDSDTLPSPCRLLAIMVIEAALNSRGEPDEIMSAFAAGCRRLQVRGLAHVKPRAFYAVY